MTKPPLYHKNWGNKMAEKKIKVYSTSTCPWCSRVKDFLKEKKIEFEDIDVSLDQKAAEEMVRKSGQMGVPVIDINGKIIIGFDKEEIEKALSE
jgi:glutaredoxin 3